MALTIISRPDDVSAAYLPVIYKFTSDLSPNAIPGQNASIGYIFYNVNTFIPGIPFDTVVVVGTQVINGLQIGDYVTIEGNEQEGWNGIFKVKYKHSTNQGIFAIDAGNFFVGAGGSASKYYKDYSAVIDIYVDGQIRGRQRKQKDINNEFIFDISKELSQYVGSDLLDIGETGIAISSTGLKDYYIQYAEEYRVVDSDGVSTIELQDFTDDSSETRQVVNTVIPYVFIRNGAIESTSYDMSDFAFDSFSGTFRFLTDMPKEVSIGEDESYQLSFVAFGNGTIGDYKRRVRTYDSTGVLITSDISTGVGVQSTDKFMSMGCGTENLGALITSSVAYYIVDVWHDGGNTYPFEEIKFNVDRKCYKNEWRFYWLNSLGGIDSYTFKGEQIISQSTERKTFKRELASPRVIPERQLTTNYVETNHVFNANSGLMIKEMSEWVSQIVNSAEIYLEMSGEYLPIQITSSDTAISDTKERMYNVSFDYIFSFDEVRQNN